MTEETVKYNDGGSAIISSTSVLTPSTSALTPDRLAPSIKSALTPSTSIPTSSIYVPPKEMNGEDCDIYQCDKCEYSSNKKQYLKQHVELVHTNERPFQCPFCDYAGKRQQSLKEHLIVHSSDKPFECTRCNATFRKKGHLTKHIQMHSKRTEIKCHFCLDLFVNSAVMAEHIRVEHPNETVYMCEACQVTVSSKDEILLHFATTHQQNILKCPSCRFMCQTESELAAHQSSKHVRDKPINQTPIVGTQSEASIPIPLVIKCSVCGFTTSSTSQLQKHMLIHIDEENAENAARRSEKPRTLYKCNKCKYISSEAHSFISHITAHETRETEVKDGTDRIFNIDSSPKPRSKFTLDKVSGRYMCEICDYTCDHQRAIKAHIWKHLGHKDVNYPMFRNGPLSVYEGMFLTTGGEFEGNEDEGATSSSAIPAFTVPLNSLSKVGGCLVKVNLSASTSETVNLAKEADDGQNKESESAEVKILKVKSQRVNEIFGNSAYTASNVKLTRLDINDRKMNEVLQKYCTSGANVVVETTNQICQNLTGLRSEGSSPLVCETESVGTNTKCDDINDLIASSVNSEIAQECSMEVEVETSGKTIPVLAVKSGNQEDDADATEEPALTLLSLLKQGPNINPVCPTSFVEAAGDGLMTTSSNMAAAGYASSVISHHSTEGSTDRNTETSSITETESSENDMRKNKAGICSSLLAVIEQLHKRYDSEIEVVSKPIAKPQRRSYKRKIKEMSNEDISIESLDNVERTDDSGLKYRCKLCHYTNPCASVLKQHMRLHKIKKPFECSLCDFVGESNESLQDHMIQHCKVRMYQCKLCDSAFSYKSQLRAHTRAHIDRMPFVCKQCTYATSDAISFREHVYDHFESQKKPASVKLINSHGNQENQFEIDEKLDDEHEDDGIGEKEVKCHHCDFMFTSYSGMRLHARTHQDDLPPLKCALCEFNAVSSRSLKSHMKRHVNDQRYVQQPLEQYRCNICGYVCHHLPSLKSHMWRHASDRNYSYEFTNEVINKAIDYDSRLDDEQQEFVALMDSREANAGKSPLNVDTAKSALCFVTFLCCQCGFETIDKASLSSHMKVHADIIQQTLDISGKTPIADAASDVLVQSGDSE